MAIGSYQLPNPRAVDPYPIETELGKQLPSPLATLALYRADRDLAHEQYGNELAGQHEFARQQLIAQVANERMARVNDLLGKPGGADLLRSGVPGLNIGASPEALGQLAAAGNEAQGATNLQHAAAGLNSAAEAGFRIAPGSVPSLARYDGTMHEPVKIEAERIQAAGRAAAASAGQRVRGTTVSTTGTPQGPGSAATNYSRPNVPDDQVEAVRRLQQGWAGGVLEERSGNAPIGTAPATNLQPAIVTTPSVSGSPTTSASPGPNKPGGKPTAAAGIPPGYQPLDTNSPNGVRAQNLAMKLAASVKDDKRPEVQRDLANIQGRMPGAVYVTVMDARGKLGVVGKDGRVFKLEE